MSYLEDVCSLFLLFQKALFLQPQPTQYDRAVESGVTPTVAVGKDETPASAAPTEPPSGSRLVAASGTELLS